MLQVVGPKDLRFIVHFLLLPSLLQYWCVIFAKSED